MAEQNKGLKARSSSREEGSKTLNSKEKKINMKVFLRGGPKAGSGSSSLRLGLAFRSLRLRVTKKN